METTYIAICFGYWGKGDTEAKALAQLRKAGGGKKDHTFVYRIEYETGKDAPQRHNVLARRAH
jgi:hypothetical protein